MRLVWHEAKRWSNLKKHGLDFIDSVWVLDSLIRLDIASERQGEWRCQSFAYVYKVLAVLALVHLPFDEGTRIISYRRASEEEERIYHGWLENHFNDDQGRAPGQPQWPKPH